MSVPPRVGCRRRSDLHDGAPLGSWDYFRSRPLDPWAFGSMSMRHRALGHRRIRFAEGESRQGGRCPPTPQHPAPFPPPRGPLADLSAHRRRLGGDCRSRYNGRRRAGGEGQLGSRPPWGLSGSEHLVLERRLLRLRHPELRVGQPDHQHPSVDVERWGQLDLHQHGRAAYGRFVGRPGETWAPSVAFNGAEFVMYYTATDISSGDQCIGVATASAPLGRYTTPTPTPSLA